MSTTDFDPYQPPASAQADPGGYDARGRIIAVSLCTLLSAPGLLGSLVLTLAAATPPSPLRAPTVLDQALPLVALCVLVAWCCYFVMAAGWIRNQQVHRAWPTVGMITGVISALFFTLLSLLVLPAMVLAFVMLGFHVSSEDEPTSADDA